MDQSESISIILAILILSLVISFKSILDFDSSQIGVSIIFAVIIITANVLGKKLMASKLDSGVEHKIWHWSRYGFKSKKQFKKEIPAGFILPLFFSILTLGTIKLMTILTYETRALKRRAAKRFGHYSFTEMTEWHNSLVGAAGITFTLLIALISYFIPGLEGLPKVSSFYALSNLIPFSRLDGTQIFFGSRVLWLALTIVSLVFVSYSFILI